MYTKRVNSSKMCLPDRKDIHLLVHPRFTDILAEIFSDIRPSFSQSLLKSHNFYCLLSRY